MHLLPCLALLHLCTCVVVTSPCRTAYYHTLARLLFMEDTPSRFKTFMLPLQQVRAYTVWRGLGGLGSIAHMGSGGWI
jgi:hypothetical protein